MNTETEYNLKAQLRHWKRTAIYLADCHAATLEGIPKSISKSERKRMVRLCENASHFLQGNTVPSNHRETDDEALRDAISRCERAAKNHATP